MPYKILYISPIWILQFSTSSMQSQLRLTSLSARSIPLLTHAISPLMGAFSVLNQMSYSYYRQQTISYESPGEFSRLAIK